MIGYNPDTGEWQEYPALAVRCGTPACENAGVVFYIADNGVPGVCGPCGAELTTAN